MGEFNADELVAPSWMDERFFEDVLRKSENDKSIEIRNLKITPGSGKGDHYASILFRATITYDTSKAKGNFKSMIIKTMPELDGHKKEMLGESYIFETEIGMYSKTIPQMEAELRKIGDNTVLGAKALYYSLEPRKCIIFEDIVPQGYETLQNRLVTLEEAKATLLKLAKWHAVSHKLAYEGDKSITEYKESFFNMKDVETMPFIVTGMENFIAKIETIDELSHFVPKLKLIQKDLIARCVKSFKSYRQESPKGIFALCHGDFHAKNMMFKRNKKDELEDVMLLDFQMCHFGPVVLDVIYSMYMLINVDLRRDNRDELIYYYASNFIETLEKLKFQGKYPKVADLYIEIIRHQHFEIFLLSGFLPMMYEMIAGTAEFDDMMTSNDARRKVYDNPDFVKEAKTLLPIMLHKGYLD